jgi:hypothetical protein
VLFADVIRSKEIRGATRIATITTVVNIKIIRKGEATVTQLSGLFVLHDSGQYARIQSYDESLQNSCSEQKQLFFTGFHGIY